MKVNINDIVISSRKRKLNKDKVSELAESLTNRRKNENGNN